MSAAPDRLVSDERIYTLTSGLEVTRDMRIAIGALIRQAVREAGEAAAKVAADKAGRAPGNVGMERELARDAMCYEIAAEIRRRLG